MRYALLDIVCVGLGMGVPLFCLLLGLPAGWYIARRIAASPFDAGRMLSRMLLGAAVTSAFTLIGMAALWSPWIPMLFDPAADLARLGAPRILFEPRASFIGWLILMIVISPFLQFLMTLLGSHVTMLWWLSRRGRTPGNEGGEN